MLQDGMPRRRDCRPPRPARAPQRPGRHARHGVLPARPGRRHPPAGSGKVDGGILAALIAASVLDPATARVRELIGARTAAKDEAETLRLRPGVSVLTAERLTRDGEAQPVELLYRVANARRIRLQADDLPLRTL
ncbi:UTRA domain-containing protein [Nonomuraea sp. H19]|uniref:UTRA domain-containing protein n=1 Tax=Nonomuraea sp. H19 TaxID=3452206 RepID=UPI003F8A131A